MSASLDAQAEPNLTPILDMVFQLITFFMLLMNFKSSELDAELHLPVVGSAAPVDLGGGLGDMLILNIDADGHLKVQGRIWPDVKNFIRGEGKSFQESEKRRNPNYKPGEDLPTIVVVRADKDARFRYIYEAVKACQEQGFRRFNYMAKTPEPK